MTPDYDKVLDAPKPGAPASAPDKYDALMDGYDNVRKVRSTATTRLAVEQNPDAYAAARKSAQQMGYPVGVASFIPEQVQREARVRTVQADSANSTTLQRRYSDSDFAKLAHDDSGVLSALGTAARYLVSADDDKGLGNDVRAGGLSARAGYLGVSRAIADFFAPLMAPLEAARANAHATGDWRAAMTPIAFGNPAQRFADTLGTFAQTQQQAAEAAGSKFDGNFGKGVASGVQSLTQSALMLPAALAGAPEGVVLGSLSLLQGGLSYQKAREAGLSPSRALGYGTLDAAVEYATEKIPLARLIGGVKAGAPVLQTFMKTVGADVPGELVATTLQNLNEWATLNPDKPFSAFVAEQPDALAQTFVAALIGSGGHVTIAHAMQSVADNASNTRRGEAAGISLQQLLALAAQSKLRERAPEVFAETVNEMATEAGAPAEIRFDARTLGEAFNQAGLDINTVLPSAAAQMQEALLTGGEVTVPVGEFAANIIGTPLEQSLQQHARIGENELSQAEAQEAAKQAEKFLQEQAQRVVEQAQEQGAQQVGADQVRTVVLDQLTQANRFTAPVNEAYATLAGSWYAATAQRLGITADELYQRFPLRVVNESTDTDALSEKVQQTYHRYTRGGADTGVGYMMFAEQRDKVESGYGSNHFEFKSDDFPEGQVVYAGSRQFRKLVEAAFDRHPEVTRQYQASAADLANEVNPADIVNSAAIWDAPELVHLIYDEVLAPNGWKAVETTDGAIVFDIAMVNGEGAYAQSKAVGHPVPSVRSPDGQGDSGGRTAGRSGSAGSAVDLNQGPRGAFVPSTMTIELLEKADLSTFLHELGHAFLEFQTELALQPDAPAAIRADMDVLLKWWGIDSTETWAGMSLNERRKYHEQFAESFEQYLLEGKAPSTELQPLFSKFRAWLVNVYRSLQNFLALHNTQLTDEVRGVMDRLIATEQQIREAEQARAYAPLFKSAAQAGMTPEAWAQYQAQGSKATEEALSDLQRRSLRDMRWLTGARSRALKALQKDAAAKRKAVESEVTAEVGQQPIYQAMRWLRTGEMTTAEGESIKADKGFRLGTEALAEMYPESALGNPELERLKGMTAKNGMHPDLVAPMFGYESGDQLVRALADAEPMNSVVGGMTDQRVLERFGDLGTEAGLQRAADEAVHNEARGRFIAGELKALTTAMNPRERTATGGSVNVLVRMAKTVATTVVAQRRVRDLRPGQFTQAETRAGRAAQKALAANDLAAAAQAQQDKLVNHYLAREAMRAQAEIERGVDYLKKFDKASIRTKLPPEYLDQIDKLLERVDLRQVTNREADKRAKLAAWIKSQEDLGIEPSIPDELLEDVQLQPYREMTVEAFRGLVDAVKQIEHLGRLKNKLLTAKDQREFDAVREELVAQVLAAAQGRQADTRTPTTNLGRALQTLRNFGAAHIKAATWARVFDGGKDGGPFWERFIRPANERADRETAMRAEATKALSEIMAPVLKQKLGGSGTFYPSINRALNREGVLTLALNTGNDSNLQRLLGGEGWTYDQIQPVLGSMTAAEWATVQAIWDYFETYRPQIGAMEQRMFGKEPAWVEPVERTVQTADGQSLTLRGGYYPVKYDPAASIRAEQHADAEGAKRQLQNAYSAATVRRGFTKGRAEEVTGRPLLYSLKGVYDGVNDVIHYLNWQEWLIDMNRLLKNQSLDSAIRNSYGPAAVKQLRTWRDAVAEGESGTQEALDEALGKLRQSVSVAGLGFNVMSALMQPLGLTQSIVRVGARWVGKGLTQYVAAPVAVTKEVNEKSSFMRNRSRTRFRELNELRNKVQGQATYKEYVGRYAYWLMMRVQQGVDVPTWLGGYEKAIAHGETEERAIALADQAVKDSQGGGQTLDLSAIERGGPAQKLFTVFYSFMNTALNLGVAAKMTPGGKAKFAADMLLLYSVPAVLGAILKDALTPGDSGDDEEKLARKLVSEQISFLLGLVVVGREFSELAKIVAGEQGHGYNGPAGLRAIGDALQFAKQARRGEFDDAFRKATVNLAGDLMGLPSAQINRTITGAKALAEGETQNPAAVVLGFQKPK